MATQVKYEWSLETVNADGDIIDSDFSDTLEPLITRKDPDTRIVLVRNEGSELDGVTDRFWAYIKDGSLPEKFEDANGSEINIKVPQKFHKEFKKFYHV